MSARIRVGINYVCLCIVIVFALKSYSYLLTEVLFVANRTLDRKTVV